VNFRIYRVHNPGLPWHWHIGINNWIDKPSIHFYKAAKLTELPPVNGWRKIEHDELRVLAKGVDPTPTLTYKYKTNDDIIASSFSDSVKKEDTTKVKEELYGGETDEEEDKKITAVPSLVSSSSQLTKSAYDEDTDEDIAPDTVHSSQLKVKEEEEDTDDEVISPDHVESAQVKEEEDLYGQDTDDEDRKVAAAPSPIVSSKVKSEPGNSYDMETDDEEGNKLDAPSPVVSSQVKNEEVNSYDMDTDGEDDTLVGSSSTESEAHSSLGTVKVSVVKPSVDAKLGLTLYNEDPTTVTITKIAPDSLFSGTRLKAGMRLDMMNENKYSSYKEYALLAAQCININIVASQADETDDSESEVESFASCESKSSTTWDSSNEAYNETAKVYLWCKGQYSYEEYALVLLPYNQYLFWKKLKQCKTWGDIRKLCNKKTYNRLLERYEMKHEYDSDYEQDVNKLADNKAVCIGDFDLEECSDDDTPQVDMFPPPLEQVMWDGAASQKQHEWMLDYGEVTEAGNSGQCWLKFKLGDKDKIFKKIEELGCTVRHFPRLGEEFISIFQM